VSEGPTVDHSAAASALGYQYQINWALVELLKRGVTRPDQAITLELHDDVAWDQTGHPVERIQVKHHLNRQSGLGDASTDVWRTLKVWMDTANPTDSSAALLTLITTATAATGSAAALLRDTADRSPADALRLLETAASGSTNQETAAARAQFLGLTPADRGAFVSRIYVSDSNPVISDLDSEIRHLLWLAMPTEAGQAQTYLDLIWRWWASVSLDLLTGKRIAVDVEEARQQVASIRDMFQADNLPTIVELGDVDEESTVDLHLDRPFVHQMRWVKVKVDNLRTAIVDYHRAVTQTTNWLDRDLVGIDELERFERNLVEEWRRSYGHRARRSCETLRRHRGRIAKSRRPRGCTGESRPRHGRAGRESRPISIPPHSPPDSASAPRAARRA